MLLRYEQSIEIPEAGLYVAITRSMDCGTIDTATHTSWLAFLRNPFRRIFAGTRAVLCSLEVSTYQR